MKLVSSYRRAMPVTAATFTTKQNDLAVDSTTRVLRWNGAGSTGITGIAAPSMGQVLTIVNASTDYLLWLENENTASSAANRLMLPDSFPAFLMPGDTITLWYDTASSRWRVLSWPTRGQGMGFQAFWDNVGSVNDGMTSSASGTGATVSTAAVGSGSQNSKGASSSATGTTSTGYAHIHPGTNQCFMREDGPYLVGARVSVSATPDATENFEVEIGLSNRLTAAAFARGALWSMRWNGSSAEWRQRCGDGSTFTDSTTNSPPADTSNVELFVFLNSGGTRADFIKSEDGVNYVLCTAQGGLPASGLWQISHHYLITKSAGLTIRTLYIDWRGWRISGGVVRP